MSGLLRNFLTLVLALLACCFKRGRASVGDKVCCYFWITPWDIGINTLKSDKYFQLAESAQLDFVIKTTLLGRMLSRGVAFVNVAQMVSFIRPLHVFQRVKVETCILYADEKCAYFSHAYYAGDTLHAELLVRMKFKRGRLTVDPFALLDLRFKEQPPQLLAWDQALEAIASVRKSGHNPAQ